MVGVLSAGCAASDIRRDETVVFFNTWAYPEDGGQRWVVPVRGWVFEPEMDSISRAATIAVLRELLDLDDDDAESAVFARHARPFLVDNERGKIVHVRLGGGIHAIGPSGVDGHFRGLVHLAAAEVERMRNAGDIEGGWLRFEAVLPAGDTRSFAGFVQFLGETGISVVSDIDDTVRITKVRDLEAAARNTFLREFRAVPGMAEVYARWAREGASFHFVSGSPWQLYGLLTEFLEREGFPRATFALKPVRLKDSSVLDLLAEPQETKPADIEPLLTHFPNRRFIFVGDSGEKDPEVYGRLAREYADRVAGVLIRNVTNDSPASKRYQQAFEGLPRDRWRLFDEADELLDVRLPGFSSAGTRPATTAGE